MTKRHKPAILYPYVPLPQLPPGPWRSRGGIFDYEHWNERDLFRGLDVLIGHGPKRRARSAELPKAA